MTDSYLSFDTYLLRDSNLISINQKIRQAAHGGG